MTVNTIISSESLYSTLKYMLMWPSWLINFPFGVLILDQLQFEYVHNQHLMATFRKSFLIMSLMLSGIFELDAQNYPMIKFESIHAIRPETSEFIQISWFSQSIKISMLRSYLLCWWKFLMKIFDETNRYVNFTL